ncbi:MAG TPA: 30S ribosomal protein S8 [Candidatus Paceibacterota bacterium]
MVNDPVADFITQLKNAAAVKKASVSVPYSKLKHAVATKLAEGGYVQTISKRGKKARKLLEVEIRYDNGSSRIKGVDRVSKPGRRIYMSVSSIQPVRFGKGSLILSTPKGIMTGEEAKKEHVGGEVLFKIW